MTIQQITAVEANKILTTDYNSVLIDVRTFEEFNFVGTVNPQGFNNRMILLPWQFYNDHQLNPDFYTILRNKLINFFNKEDFTTKLIFICRSGARSNQAGSFISNYGYSNCYNVSDGFEGKLDQYHHRSKINGWKAHNLPWEQT
jgi:rhodanese-related sulfurtransferase